MSILQQTFKLANGVEVNKVGFGTWQTKPEDAYTSVKFALNNGYRHVDTAIVYGNQQRIGEAVADSKVDRKNIFITSKVPPEIKSYQEAKASIQQALDELNMDYVDLLLIHSPRPWKEMFLDQVTNHYYAENKEVWKAMEEAYKENKIRAIGVSNFSIDDIEHLMEDAEISPQVNQVKYHVGHTDPELVQFCKQHNILVEGYSPNATGQLLDNKDIQKVADKYNKSVPQIGIRYLLEKGILPLPKSVHSEYIIQNADVDFEMKQEDISYLDTL